MERDRWANSLRHRGLRGCGAKASRVAPAPLCCTRFDLRTAFGKQNGVGRCRPTPWTAKERRLLDAGHILRGGTFLALHHVELHLLSLAKRLEAAAGNGGVMNEAVFPTIITSDEAEALAVVEPLHGPFGAHTRTPCCVFDVRRSAGLPYWPMVASVSRSDAPAQGCRGTRGAKQKKDPCVAAQGPLQSLVLGARCPARVLNAGRMLMDPPTLRQCPGRGQS